MAFVMLELDRLLQRLLMWLYKPKSQQLAPESLIQPLYKDHHLITIKILGYTNLLLEWLLEI